MRVVAYCRYSSEGQRDGYSIEAQMRAIADYCEREHYNLVGSYIDEARTGTNADRDAFQRMISEANSKNFQAVIVHKLDRFARDRYDSAFYKKKLKDNGVRLISVLEPLDGSPESVILESVLEGMAEYYSRNLSREVQKGKKEAALKAQHNGGMIPYGYSVDDKMRYVVVPEEAAFIREVFKRIDAGQSYGSISRWAAAAGYKNRRGSVIGVEFIRRLPLNTMYAGQFRYGDRSAVKGYKHKMEAVILDNAIEPIVDPDVFWRIHDEAMRRRRGPQSRNKGNDYILTGYLQCAYCGEMLTGFQSKKSYHSRDGHAREYLQNFYRCPSKYRQKKDAISYEKQGCLFKNIQKETLEDFVLSAIKHNIFSDKGLDFLVSKINARIQERKSELNKGAETASSELKKLAQQQARLLDIYLSGDIAKDAYAVKNAELDQRIQFFQNELAKLEVSKNDVTPEMLKKAILRFEEMNVDSPEYRKRLISTFVDSITLDNERIVIYFKLFVPGASSKVESDFVRNKTNVSTYVILRTEYLVDDMYIPSFDPASMQLVC